MKRPEALEKIYQESDEIIKKLGVSNIDEALKILREHESQLNQGESREICNGKD